MKKVLGVILGGLLLLPVVSNAADAQKAADNKKPVNSWTCEDFLAVDKQANFKDKVKGEWDKIKKDM